MSPAITLATARRILSQLRHDHRTLGLIVGVPSLLMVLLVLIALSVVGVATLTLSQTESSVAGARSYRRQALAAAEAGFNHFIGTSPANLAPRASSARPTARASSAAPPRTA